ncbi:hypothetical protein [Kitasatospora sp. HPMI-4]|uniref:hypothetical protein n=1 Tax=Kitasatospora sp. HPMI-4 TaxID=3448443 RepID=UPI003F19B7AE
MKFRNLIAAAAAAASLAMVAAPAADAASVSPHSFPYACGYGGPASSYRIGPDTRIDPGTTYCVIGYELAMQNDGNLVIYSESGALWSSGTWGHSGAYAKFQLDGNLVVYQSPNAPLWSTKTNGHQNATLEFTNSSGGDLIVRDANGGMLWDRYM